MEKKEKDILLKDLCARTPYYVDAQITYKMEGETKPFTISKTVTFDDLKSFENGDDVLLDIKPYLRPLKSMTEKEKQTYLSFCYFIEEGDITSASELVDFYLSHHLDYKELIEKNLALVAPDNMYNFK